MVAGGKKAQYNALQVENLLLLIDRETADEVGGPWFAFAPSPCGPYDAAVLETVESLAAAGSAVIDEAGPYWVCFASEAGYDRGSVHSGGAADPSAAVSAEGRPMDPDRAVLVDDGGDIPPLPGDGS